MSGLREITNTYSDEYDEADTSYDSYSTKTDSVKNYSVNNFPSYTSYSEGFRNYKNHGYNMTTPKNITKIYDWIIHIGSNSLEYASGYCDKASHPYNIWDTSYIKTKIPLSDSLLIITENESIYELPYKECGAK